MLLIEEVNNNILYYGFKYLHFDNLLFLHLYKVGKVGDYFILWKGGGHSENAKKFS